MWAVFRRHLPGLLVRCRSSLSCYSLRRQPAPLDSRLFNGLTHDRFSNLGRYARSTGPSKQTHTRLYLHRRTRRIPVDCVICWLRMESMVLIAKWPPTSARACVYEEG